MWGLAGEEVCPCYKKKYAIFVSVGRRKQNRKRMAQEHSMETNTGEKDCS